MSDEFRDLRACIYTNEAELKRFRQVVVNVVLATGKQAPSWCFEWRFVSFNIALIQLIGLSFRHL